MDVALERVRIEKGEDPLRFLDDVFRFAMARIGSREEAEDIAIEVVQELKNAHRRDLKIYMLGMARRKVANRLRKKSREYRLSELNHPVSFETNVEDAAHVAQVLQRLSDEHREALILKYVAELTSQEIGVVMDRKSTGVDSLLQRARAAFAEVWEATSSDEVLK